ncbi:MAG: flagellar motor switch protein FliM [Oscillospiraceae bacterium]|nr:flagellar motor switch protein FliM [Oscillospiraceae bacterium]
MADVLSQSQIDALLNSFSANGSEAFEEIEANDSNNVKNYDFRMPRKFTKEQLKSVEGIFETYARVVSSYLTGLLRLYCKVEVLQIEEQRYNEFNNALPDYVLLSTIDMGIEDEDVMETSVIMQISNPVTYCMIDRLMGGDGQFTEINRDFTEIEVGLMTNVINKLTASLKQAWDPYIEIHPKLTNVETNARVLQSIAPDDVVILVMLELEIRKIKNTISICIPALNLESMMAKFSDRFSKNGKKFDANKDNERREEILNGIKNSKLKIDAILSETQVDLYDILTLQPGDIIPLNMSISDNVTVKIGEHIWFDGKLGEKNDHKAIKIDNIYKN